MGNKEDAMDDDEEEEDEDDDLSVQWSAAEIDLVGRWIDRLIPID